MKTQIIIDLCEKAIKSNNTDDFKLAVNTAKKIYNEDFGFTLEELNDALKNAGITNVIFRKNGSSSFITIEMDENTPIKWYQHLTLMLKQGN